MKFTLVTGLALLARQATAFTSTPYNPSAYPLAVRSPYLSTWLPGGSAGGQINGIWPTFWQGAITGWAGYIRVDGTTYTWLGAPVVAGAQNAVQTAATFTSTQSTFTLTAGPVTLKATFLSPVEPDDFVRQSLPFSYLSVGITSADGGAHSVQLYTDISAEWVSGDSNLNATWSTTADTKMIYHKVQLQNPAQYTESNDHTQYGSAYYATTQATGLTYQTGEDAILRGQFIANGTLTNDLATRFRPINQQWPCFAFSYDLGSIKTTAAPINFVIGHVRSPAVSYITKSGMQDRYLYWESAYGGVPDALSSFLNDYSRALTAANTLDSKIATDAGKISGDYASITALSVRQAFAATEITISKDSSGKYNTSDVMIFMKEISSNGNVNTVDIIFPAYPIFLYTNPEFCRYLLEPLFQYQASGLYPNKYSIHDIGASYPNASGHNNGGDEAMPIEESGNMLIMALAYAQKAGKTDVLSRYYNLLSQWTQFLVSDSLIPANQISTDDFAGPLANQTNLAVKGIIGIKSMSEIAGLLGKTADHDNFAKTAASYVTKWRNYATSNDSHLTLAYGNDSSHGLIYNLYSDKMLKLNLFPKDVYNMQTNFYKGLFNAYGIPLDTRHAWTKTDWMIYTAGTVTDLNLRNQFVSAVKAFSSNGKSGAPFPDLYETDSGNADGFKARPVVGGHFALLALIDNQDGVGQSSAPPPSSHNGAGKMKTVYGVLATSVIVVVSSLFL